MMGRSWTRAHPTDRELFDLLIPGSEVPTAADAAARSHLSRCESCADRSEALQRFLDGVSETTRADVEPTLSAEHLASQRRRIGQRLRRLVDPQRPGRVLRFPATFRAPTPQMYRAGRWLTAAAVSGLVIGTTVGQFLHLHPATEPTVGERSAQTRTSDAGASVSARTPAASSSIAPIDDMLFSLEDDAFLDAVDLMVLAPRIPELDSLDEITPRIREVAVTPW